MLSEDEFCIAKSSYGNQVQGEFSIGQDLDVTKSEVHLHSENSAYSLYVYILQWETQEWKKDNRILNWKCVFVDDDATKNKKIIKSII